MVHLALALIAVQVLAYPATAAILPLMSGRIYFTYESQNKASPNVRALIRFESDGTGGTLLGDVALAQPVYMRQIPLALVHSAQGVPHGLKIGTDADGTEYLYHANNAAILHKTTLDGEYVWSTNMTSLWAGNPEHWPFKPTDVEHHFTVIAHITVLQTAGSLYVADGYGLSK
eukprot:gene6985-1249_t